VFFKTKPGEYAEQDQFLGVPVPKLRKIAKINQSLSLELVIELLGSPINEERLLALFILVARYQKGDTECKKQIYQLYQANIKQVNNWNLVDASAHLIVGSYLHEKDKRYLLDLALSNTLWERRIAMVATWYFIRQNEFDWVIKIAELLLNDKQDLIHKAVGWMLREMGKRHNRLLITFLETHAHHMPRTTLRYAIEKLNPELRTIYLAKKLAKSPI
jgi:3-methyladenine DNA glycosylase AlkD